MTYKKIKVPKKGNKISYKDGKILVPDNPIIPFIEGDGIGVDITPPMIKVVNEAVKVAYGNKKKIEWMEVFCGEKATKVYSKDTWLPEETIEALKEYVVSIKGPFNYACWWWHKVIKCFSSSINGSLRLLKTNKIF